jgi:hypothetical protein
MTKKEYAAYQAAFASFKEEMGLANISTGLLRCPDCKVDLEGCDCPKCGKNMIEFPNEAYFSWNPCDCCGRPEGGDRMDANGYNPTTQEIEEFVICTDCEYYAEYGRLDDTTMDEISNDTDDRYTFEELAEGMKVRWRGIVGEITEKNDEFIRFVEVGGNVDNPFRLYQNHIDTEAGEKLTVFIQGEL